MLKKTIYFALLAACFSAVMSVRGIYLYGKLEFLSVLGVVATIAGILSLLTMLFYIKKNSI